MKTSPQIYSQILFRGICSTDRGIQSFVAPLMNPLARGYEELYKTQKRSETLQESKKDEFFGLRDFYRYECSLLSLYSLILCMFFFSIFCACWMSIRLIAVPKIRLILPLFLFSSGQILFYWLSIFLASFYNILRFFLCSYSFHWLQLPIFQSNIFIKFSRTKFVVPQIVLLFFVCLFLFFFNSIIVFINNVCLTFTTLTYITYNTVEYKERKIQSYIHCYNLQNNALYPTKQNGR